MIVAGIDLGTQSLKVLVYDSDKHEILATVSEPLALISDKGGVREQKAVWWTDALLKCFSLISEDIRKRITSLAVSGQQHGFVPLSKDGGVLASVKLWCDTSTEDEVDEITRKYGGEEKLIKNVGNPIRVGYTASKILYLKKHDEASFSKLSSVLLPHDYLNYYLTGECFTERGDASGTGLFNLYKGQYDEELSSIIDEKLYSKLVPLIDPLKDYFPIKRDAAKALGLSDKVTVCAGGGDNMMGAIGTGAVDDGVFTISLGTSGTLFTSANVPIIDDRGIIAAFSSSHNSYLPLLCTMNCTAATEISRKRLNLSVKDFDNLASTAPIGSEGVVFLPFFNGERSPNYPKGKGVIGGLNPLNFKEENIARSTLEGVSYEFLLGLSRFEELGARLVRINLTGGGAKSPFWSQMISDITNLPVFFPSESEAAAFGAALQALAVCSSSDISTVVKKHVKFKEKILKADPERAECYKKHYKKWMDYSNSLSKIFS